MEALVIEEPSPPPPLEPVTALSLPHVSPTEPPPKPHPRPKTDSHETADAHDTGEPADAANSFWSQSVTALLDHDLLRARELAQKASLLLAALEKH
jgi:hypothetical protein